MARSGPPWATTTRCSGAVLGNRGQTPISSEIGVCPLFRHPEHLVVVAHGGPLRAIAGHLLGMPPERWLGLDFGCGQVTRIDVESWGVVLKWFNR